jgi:G3E family GTPase
MSKCEFCNSNFTTIQSLKRHYDRCKEKRKIQHEQELQTQQQQHEQELQTQQQQHEQELQTQQQQHEQELQTQQIQTQQQLHSLTEKIRFQQQQHDQQIQNLTNQYEKQIEILKEQLDEFKTQIFEIAKQPKQINNNTQTTTNNNQRIMNITNQLIPMNLSKDDLRHLVTKYYTTDTFLGGPESIAQMTVDHILIDQESGKFRVVCTDTARGIFYYQDADNNLIRDIGMQKIQEKLIAPLNEATRLEYERLEKKNQMHPHRLTNLYGENLSCIRSNELPNRVKKSIQLPIANTSAPTTAPTLDSNQE